ncbi:hypothetical protein EV1_002827 [Malus domestica]
MKNEGNFDKGRWHDLTVESRLPEVPGCLGSSYPPLQWLLRWLIRTTPSQRRRHSPSFPIKTSELNHTTGSSYFLRRSREAKL